MFNRLDSDGSGTVSLHEIENLDKSDKALIYGAMSIGNPIEIFHALDVDNDGSLDIDEFCDGIYQVAVAKTPILFKRIEKQLRQLFKASIQVLGQVKSSEDSLYDFFHELLGLPLEGLETSEAGDSPRSFGTPRSSQYNVSSKVSSKELPEGIRNSKTHRAQSEISNGGKIDGVHLVAPSDSERCERCQSERSEQPQQKKKAGFSSRCLSGVEPSVLLEDKMKRIVQEALADVLRSGTGREIFSEYINGLEKDVRTLCASPESAPEIPPATLKVKIACGSNPSVGHCSVAECVKLPVDSGNFAPARKAQSYDSRLDMKRDYHDVSNGPKGGRDQISASTRQAGK